MRVKDQLFMIETFITEIHFSADFDVSDPEALVVNFAFSDMWNYDVEPRLMKVTLEKGHNDNTNSVVLNMGKSFLFICDMTVLKKILKVEPLQVTLMMNTKQIGYGEVHFKEEFNEMLKFFDTIGIVKSCTMQQKIHMRNQKKIEMASMDVTIRMSCFGGNLQTQFYLKETPNKKQEYIFRYKTTGAFIKCERTREADFIPVSALYGFTGNPRLKESDINVAENVSLTSLYDARKQSLYPDEDFDVVSICFRPSENKFFDLLNLISADVKTADGATCVKIKTTKDFNKDLENFMANISPSPLHKEPTELNQEQIEKLLCNKKDCPAARKFKEYGIGPLATGKGLGTLYNYVEPPVLYGLSHTYGTMDNYGPYGLFSKPKRPEDDFVPAANISELELGPCRQKVRQKRPTSQVATIPPKANTSEKAVKKAKSCKHQQLLDMPHSKRCPLRLNGGNMRSENKVLRLRGGASEEVALEQPKSPQEECKEVMNQLDEILNSYKRAIGPCGQATCPYAQNFAEENCKKACEKPLVIPPDTDKPISCDSIPCGMPSCPYTEPLKKAFPAGCGNPKCAYTKYKLGLVDDDAALELLYLPPAISGKCGHPKCKYPLEPELPPIHWDCPEPLPKGPCKNLNCPLQPQELKMFKVKKPQPSGPCGSPQCPYALPQPCANPTCPFSENPCPFFKDKQDSLMRGNNATCANPDCSYNKKNKDNIEDDPRFKADIIQNSDTLMTSPKCEKKKKTDVCGNPNCPSAEKKHKESESLENNDVCCENPTCPFAIMMAEKALRKKSKRRHKEKSKLSFCDNPDCEAKEKESNCSNPNCPLAQISKGQADGDNGSAGSICSNPDCPYNEKKSTKKKNVCSNQDCPFNKPKSKKKKQTCGDTGSATSICSNPDCPSNNHKSKKQTKTCGDTGSASSVCSNSECPFAARKSKEKKKNKICSNPNCPDRDQNSGSSSASNASTCDNPDCPLKQKKRRTSNSPNASACDDPNCPFGIKMKEPICDDPICPYMQPLPSCGIPNCPFEPPCGIVVARKPCGLATSHKESKPKTCKHMKQLKQKTSPCSRMSNSRLRSESRPRNQSNSKVSAGSASKSLEDENKVTEYEQEVVQTANGDTVVTTSVTEEQTETKADGTKIRKTKKKKGKYVYSIGDKYPGLKVGHKECVVPVFHVPANMGWLWNVYTPILSMKPRRGWRPGALTRTIARMIRTHRQAKGLGMLRVPYFRKDGLQIDDDDINVKPKPTLTIQKKEGSYWVTVNPLKDPYTLAENENPYMDCTPMTFKITKNKKKVENYCSCDGDEGSEDEAPPSASSSDSQLDIEFTPPAGIIHPARFKKKRNVIHCDTQYNPKDCVVEKKGKKGKKGKDGKGKKDKKGGKGKKGGAGGKKKGKK